MIQAVLLWRTRGLGPQYRPSAATGKGLTGWSVNDKLCALTNGGGYAEYVTVPAGECLPVPAGLSVEAAAALPETFFTVWTNVLESGALKPGQTLLVHGGSSGIGTAAIQMAISLLQYTAAAEYQFGGNIDDPESSNHDKHRIRYRRRFPRHG